MIVLPVGATDRLCIKIDFYADNITEIYQKAVKSYDDDGYSYGGFVFSRNTLYANNGKTAGRRIATQRTCCNNTYFRISLNSDAGFKPSRNKRNYCDIRTCFA